MFPYVFPVWFTPEMLPACHVPQCLFGLIKRAFFFLLLLSSFSKVMAVAEPALKREVVLLIPDLVQDGQHGEAAEVLLEVIRDDSQFTAPALDSLDNLVLGPDEQARGITQSSSDVSRLFRVGHVTEWERGFFEPSPEEKTTAIGRDSCV